MTELVSESLGTKVIRGDLNEISEVLRNFGLKAASDTISPFFCGIADKNSPRLSVDSLNGLKDLLRKYPNYRIKYITDVQEENLQYVKAMAEAGFEIRHIEGLRANLGISRTEYLSTTRSLENGIPDELIWSDNQELIAQMTILFSKLWEGALPVEARINEIERGIRFGSTKLTFDTAEIMKTFQESVQKIEKDAYIIVATEEGVRRTIAPFQVLSRKSRENSLKVRILVPTSFLGHSESLEKMKLELGLEGIEFRMADRLSSNFYLGIYDQKEMITAQFAGENPRSGQGALYGTITTSHETIAAMLSIFEALWHESELRDREERSKKKAQLLQDILTHDIRNYNQVARLSAELLSEEIKGNFTVQVVTQSMLDAIDGSTKLLERASKLGKVLAEENPDLYVVDVEKIFARAFAIVKTATPKKSIDLKIVGLDKAAPVLADDLLEEVFSNILSNAVKYTKDSEAAEIEVSAGEAARSPSMLEISISDHGTGIPDEMKPLLFARYLQSAKGSGLGMSIVHALVVERYKGSLGVFDRVPGDYAKGARVTIWLPKATTP